MPSTREVLQSLHPRRKSSTINLEAAIDPTHLTANSGKGRLFCFYSDLKEENRPLAKRVFLPLSVSTTENFQGKRTEDERDSTLGLLGSPFFLKWVFLDETFGVL